MTTKSEGRSSVALALGLAGTLVLTGCFKKQDNPITGAGEPLFTLRGLVFDIDHQRPLAGAVVQIKALSLRDTVAADGRYLLEGLKVGTRNLNVSAPHYAEVTVPVTFSHEQREVVLDFAMKKELGLAMQATLPFDNPSGIWWENGALWVVSYNGAGGRIYKLDEQLNLLQSSPQVGTLTSVMCFWHVDSCLWQNGVCFKPFQVPATFVPDSVTTDSIFASCEQRLYGLVRMGDFFYTTDGAGHFSLLFDQVQQFTERHLFRIDPTSLAPLAVLNIPAFFDDRSLGLLTDLAWDGQALWLCAPATRTLPKLHGTDFAHQSVFASPRAEPAGLAWDGRYLWLMAQDELFQLYADLSIRNRYVVPLASLQQIAWDGRQMWAVGSRGRRLAKLTIPFEDHLW